MGSSCSQGQCGKRSVSSSVGTGPHPCSHPPAPESWVQDPEAGYLPCPACTGVTHMRVPRCLGVPIHVLWDAGQRLCRPSRALAERPVLSAYCERRCLAGSRAVPEPCLRVCVSVWLPCCWPLPGIWAAQCPALPSAPAPPPTPGPGHGGCLAGSSLAQAQVRAVLTVPRTTSPPSWADRKIPDIVVQRWLQAGRQQGAGARLDGLGATRPGEASVPGWAPQMDVCVCVCLCLSCTPHPSLVSPCWRWGGKCGS